MAFSENLKFKYYKKHKELKRQKKLSLLVIPTLIRNLATNVKSMGTLKNICAVLKKAMMHFFNSWHQAASHTSYFSENNHRIIFKS